jgi:hypothetical protein
MSTFEQRNRVANPLGISHESTRHELTLGSAVSNAQQTQSILRFPNPPLVGDLGELCKVTITMLLLTPAFLALLALLGLALIVHHISPEIGSLLLWLSGIACLLTAPWQLQLLVLLGCLSLL